MIPPSLAFGFVLASIYGLVFYILFGHGWTRLGLYWLVGVGGFAVGQWVGTTLGLALIDLGATKLVEGTCVSWLCLLAARISMRR